MAATTVIDQLIVKLGLDPRDFTKGEKAAAAETVKLENQVKKSSESMGSSFLGFTKKVAGIATVAVAVKRFIQYTSELSANIRQLGIDSSNFNIAASELRNFGNVAEMFGGKAEDATRTVGNLTKAVYDLAYNGQISDSLIMLGRLGVQFQDTTGNMRDFKSIALDTQAAIQQRMANGMSRANAYQILLQSGFDPGLANAMLSGTLQQQLDRQGQRRQVSRDDVALATRWEQSAANRSQALDAAALRQLPAEAVAGTAVNDAIAAAADAAGTADVSGALSEFGDTVKDAGSAVKQGAADLLLGLEKLADRAIEKSRQFPTGRKFYEPTIQEAARKYGLDPELLAGVLQTESGFNPQAKSAAGAVGITQLMPQYFKNAGQNPHADIMTAAAELSRLRNLRMKEGADADGAWNLALMDYNAGRSRVSKAMSGGKPLAQETLDYPGKVLGYAADAVPTPSGESRMQTSKTDVYIDGVTINTPRTDGEALATEFTEATRRKMLAAHADTGVQ